MPPPLDDRTLSLAEATVAARVCPRCGQSAPLPALARADYGCPGCGLHLAYLDVSGGGAVRGVLGWVKREGEVILGRYRVQAVLGQGGFGTTYLVQDLPLNGKRRALKEIPQGLFDEAEAALLSRLHHPAIPDIIDRGIEGGMVYLVLEFGGTRTLGSERQRLGGRLPLPVLVPLLDQLCRVLEFLHRQDPPIIHRDLKPDNILLDDQDHVMLIDFGIAKLAQPAQATRTLGRAVSFGFSAPEQILGTGTDPRSDIYSLGATVYFLLTGRHPPDLNAQLSGKKVEPLAKQVANLPAALDRAILKSLELDPARRPQSVAELRRLLGDVYHPPAGGAAPDRRFSRRNLALLAGLLAFLALLVGGALLLWRPWSGPDLSPSTGQSEPAKGPPRPEPTAPPATPEAPRPAPPAPGPASAPSVTPEAPRPAPSAAVPPAPADAAGAPARPEGKAPEAKIKPRRTEPARPPKPKATTPKPAVEPSAAPAERSEPPAKAPDWSGALKYEGARRTTP
ncbi:serine/threonine-protein kinase [Candidatus Methylocalor cossyra]|uniref:non-specific serine/threonine protein kinase n=1 Tax=Candidatus Methylocalor cossyra TaxID=3108543 RepID=A0ABM9NG40_9GAMM